MSVSIKSEHEIELMRHAGHLLEKVHDELASHIKTGISTKELDRVQSRHFGSARESVGKDRMAHQSFGQCHAWRLLPRIHGEEFC